MYLLLIRVLTPKGLHCKTDWLEIWHTSSAPCALHPLPYHHKTWWVLAINATHAYLKDHWTEFHQIWYACPRGKYELMSWVPCWYVKVGVVYSSLTIIVCILLSWKDPKTQNLVRWVYMMSKCCSKNLVWLLFVVCRLSSNSRELERARNLKLGPTIGNDVHQLLLE